MSNTINRLKALKELLEDADVLSPWEYEFIESKLILVEELEGMKPDFSTRVVEKVDEIYEKYKDVLNTLADGD